MIARAVGAEILQDVCEWGFGHAYLEEVVAEWDLGISDYQLFFLFGEGNGGKGIPCYRWRHFRLGKTSVRHLRLRRRRRGGTWIAL